MDAYDKWQNNLFNLDGYKNYNDLPGSKPTKTYVDYFNVVPTNKVDEKILDMRLDAAKRKVNLYNFSRNEKMMVPRNIEMYLINNNVELDDWSLMILIKSLQNHNDKEDYNHQIKYFIQKIIK